MEEAERTKKLLAGKEKLAAFQRKRAKRKKKKVEGEETGDEFSDYTYSETSSLADPNDLGSTSDLSDTASITYESDRGSVTGYVSEEEGEPRRGKVGKAVSLAKAKSNLRKASFRITELEEMLYGKQDAISRLTEENDQLRDALGNKTSPDTGSEQSLGAVGMSEDRGSTPDKDSDEALTDEAYQHKLSQFETALKQRDEVIKQLTSNLKAITESRDSLQQEYTAQAAELARQVHTLQLQLQQAGEWLKNRTGEHGISAQALLEAKNELLALQQVNLHKENDLASTQAALKQRDEMLQNLLDQYNATTQQAYIHHQQNTQLQEQNTQHTSTINQLTLELTQVREENARLTVTKEKLAATPGRDDSSASEHTEHLARLQQALQENEERIKHLEKGAKEGEAQIEKLKEALRLKDQSLQQMVLNLSGAVTSDSTKDADINSLHETITQQKQELESFQDHVRQKDQSLQQLTEKFTETSQQLSILYQEVSALKAREQEVIVLRETILERETKLTIFQETIRTREIKLIENEERWRMVEQGGLGSNHNDSTELCQKISALEAELQQRNQSLLEKDYSMQENTRQFTQALQENKRLKEIENEQQSLVVKITELTHQLTALADENKQLKEAENEIEMLAQKIPQLSQEMDRLNQENRSLKEKESEMYLMVEQLREREQILVTLDEENRSLKEKEKEMKLLENELAEKSRHLKSAEEELRKLEYVRNSNSLLQDELQKKSEEHAFLQEQLKSMELERVRFEVDSAQQTSTAATEVTDKLTSLKQDMAQREAELGSAKKELAEKDKSLKEFIQEIGVLTEHNTFLQQQAISLKGSKESVVEMEQQILRLNEMIEQRDVSINDLKETLTKQREEAAALDNENKAYKEKHNEMVSLQEHVHSLEAELAQLKEYEHQKDLASREMTEKVSQLDQEVSNLTGQIQRKEEELEALQSSLKEKALGGELANTVEKLAEETRSPSNLEMLQRAADSAEEKDNVIVSLQNKISLIEGQVRGLQEFLEQRETSLTNLSEEVQNLNQQIIDLQAESNDTLKSKEEEVAQKQTELSMLQDIVRQRDESLQDLTDNVGKFTEELVQLSKENATLRSQEEELVQKQDQVLAQLNQVNQEVTALKVENNALMVREQELHDARGELAGLREASQELTTELTRRKDQESTREAELQGLLDSAHQQAYDLQQLRDENEALRMKDAQVGNLQEEIRNRDLENSALQQKISSMTVTLDEMTIKLGESASTSSASEQLEAHLKDVLEENKALKDQQNECLVLQEQIKLKEEELVTMEQGNIELQTQYQKLQGILKEKQDQDIELAAVVEENKSLKDKVNELLAVKQPAPTSGVDISLFEEDSGTKEIAKEQHIQPEHATGVSASAEGTITATLSEHETHPAESMDGNVQKLQVTIEQKDRDMVTLHHTIQVQQQRLQEMHTKMTEFSQYVSYLGQENQALKAREAEVQATGETTRTSGETELDKDSLGSPPEHNQSQAEVTALHVYIQQQNAALDEMKTQLMALSEENRTLRVQESQLQQKMSAESVFEGRNEEFTATNSESQTETQADISTLHAYIQQQNAHIEESSKRMTEMTNYITKLQEEYSTLKTKDSNNLDTIETLTQKLAEVLQASEKVDDKKQEIEHEVERLKAENSESFTKLDGENKNLKRKERESTEVVQQLMSDIENLRRSRSQTPVAQVESVSANEHRRALDVLRAELEELHGGQIVEMKQQLREQMTGQIEELNKQLKTLSDQKEEAEHRLQKLQEATEELPPEASEVEDSHIQQIEHLHTVVKELVTEKHELQNSLDQEREESQQKAEEDANSKEDLLVRINALIRERDEAHAQVKQQEQWSWENDAEPQEETRAEIDLLNKRISELIKERDEALSRVMEVKASSLAEQQAAVTQKVDTQEDDGEAQELHQQVQHMGQQLQDLARERDNALARIQQQQQQLEKAQTFGEQQTQEELGAMQLQAQQDEALRQEIAVLSAQLRDLTTAKDEALSQVDHLKKQVETHGKDSSNETKPEQHDESSVPQRKTSPRSQKPLSPMQRQLVHLQQQLLHPQPAPSTDDCSAQSSQQATALSEPQLAVPSQDKSASMTVEPVVELQLRQMQELYDQHNKHQAQDIENLTAELNRISREREEAMTQLQEYKNRFELHLKGALDQQQKQHAVQLQALTEDLEKLKQSKEESENKLEKIHSQHRVKVKELSDQLQAWQTKFYQFGQQLNGDSSVIVEQLRTENSQFRDQIADLSSKIEALDKEKEGAKAELKEAKLAISDLEGKNPDVAAYRRKLEDLDSTLKVTWIENEELKVSIASLKEEIQEATVDPWQKAGHAATNGDTSEGVTVDKRNLQERLKEAEAELDRLHSLVGVDVIVLSRQIEETRYTYSQQLRVHRQELTAVKRELARYQTLDSDSDSSPIHAPLLSSSPNKLQKGGKQLERSDSMESINVELSRVHAEHELEVESLKKSKGEFAEELYAEKERHRDAMARMEQLLRKMVKMQQKHKDEIESMNQRHEGTVQEMSMKLEQVKAEYQLMLTEHGTDASGTSELDMKSQLDQSMAFKEQLRAESDRLKQEKSDWDMERDRLKARTGQLVGEKDLLAKERDVLADSVKKLETDRQEVLTQQRLLTAEKQQVMFEREQMSHQKEQLSEAQTQGSENTNRIHGIASQPAELDQDKLEQLEEQVTLLQKERKLLVTDHHMEFATLKRQYSMGNDELRQKINMLESEKNNEIDALKEQNIFDITEMQTKFETLESEQTKEYSEKIVSNLAEWKLEKEQMAKEYEVQLKSRADEVKSGEEQLEALRKKFEEAMVVADQLRAEGEALRVEYQEVTRSMEAQQTELGKSQAEYGHIKEECDTLHAEHSRMLEAMHKDGEEAVRQLVSQIQQLTSENQTMKEEQASVMESLRMEYEAEQQRQSELLQQLRADYELQQEQTNASNERSIESLKNKLAEVMEEVHVLRHENYDMRTVVSDPQTQHHLLESSELQRTAAPTTELPKIQADSSSPNGPASEDTEMQRKLQEVREEYEGRIASLEKQQQDALKDLEYTIEERHAISVRQLQVEAEFDLRDEVKTVKDTMKLETQRQLKLARIENERKFIEELQKARAELSLQHNSHIEELRQQYEQSGRHPIGENAQGMNGVVARLQLENQELAEARDALLKQITTSHGHVAELQEELTSVGCQKESLAAKISELEQKLTVFSTNLFTRRAAETDPAAGEDRRPMSETFLVQPLTSDLSLTSRSPEGAATSSMDQEVMEWRMNYNTLLNENEDLRKRLTSGQSQKSPSPTDSLESSANQEAMEEQLKTLHRENVELRSHLEDGRRAVQQLRELRAKYLEVESENESLIARMGAYIPQDSLDDLDTALGIGGPVEEDQEMLRLRSRYVSLSEENEVLRAKLGSYGLPTEGIAEEENMDLQTRYELIMKENEALRSKLHTYSHQGSTERDGHWKEKYDAIMHDYGVLRNQLEELSLPINDSIQKGLEELQVRFDQVVKENETLQVKLVTVRDNAECDFRELQARHSELHADHNQVSQEYSELRGLLEKDKDKSKRDYVKIKAKLNAISKETETLKNKLTAATKETDNLKVELDQAEMKAKQVAGGSSPGGATGGPLGPGVKGKKRKQERGGHGKGRKQRRESEHPEDTMDLTEQSMIEELEGLKTQHSAVLKENDSLKLEVGSLKCELGSLKARVMENLRQRLRDPPMAHSTPIGSNSHCVTAASNQNFATTPIGAGRGRPTSDLDLTLPEDVEALRVRYEAAMQELGDLRKELDGMNSKALDELMGLQSEARALQEENASMKQALHSDDQDLQDRFSTMTTDSKTGSRTDPPTSPDTTSLSNDPQDYAQLVQRCKHAEQQLQALKKQLKEVVCENDDLRSIIEKKSSKVRDETNYEEFRQGLTQMTATRRTVHSEVLVHRSQTEVTSQQVSVSKSVEDSQVLGASAAASHAQIPRRTVSLGSMQSVAVDSHIEKVDVESDDDSQNRSSLKKSVSLTIVPRSLAEGDDMEVIEAEWRHIQGPRESSSVGRAMMDQGFHPEHDSSFEDRSKPVGASIPASPQTEAQLMWPLPTPKSDTDLPLMPIEEEFKLQLETMVANFGEKDVREHLGRDYVELHQKCQALSEENENLQAQGAEGFKQISKLTQCIEELELRIQEVTAKGMYKQPGTTMGDPEGQGFGGEYRAEQAGLDLDRSRDHEVDVHVAKLEKDLTQLRDENELLLQENTSLLARCESVAAKSAWEQSVIRGDHEGELEHLQRDKANLEEEVAKIKVLYLQVKGESDQLAVENKELTGEKMRLQNELEVLRSVQESLHVEQLKVEHQIRERVAMRESCLPYVEVTGTALPSGKMDVETGTHNQESDQAVVMTDVTEVRTQGKGLRKSASPVPPVKGAKSTRKSDSSGQEAKGAKKGGKKSPSPCPGGKEGPQTKRAASPMKSVSSRDVSRGGSPAKTEPSAKAKKVESQLQLRASRETIIFDERPSITQLKQKVKELTSKNKTLHSDIDSLRQELVAADRTKEIVKMKKNNEELLKEVEEIRGGLLVQSKLQDQIQDLRHRLDTVSRENDTVKKENQVLGDRINDTVSPPMMEFDDLKVRYTELEKANRNLMEKLDRDLMQAEQELAEMRDKYEVIRLEKEEIEDEYKNCRDKLEKELYNLQSKYDETVEERDLLESQLINTREHAEKDYSQLQAGFEEMRSELEEAQTAFDHDREKARKELMELREKLESSKQDNEELKREIVTAKHDIEKCRSNQQHQYVTLQEEKHNFQRELKDYQNRVTAIQKSKDEVEKLHNDLRTRYDALEKYHMEVKTALEEENKDMVSKLNSLQEEYAVLSESVKELQREKTNLSEELNDSHAWCETLEMNLQETESHLEEEAVTLKEELHFISERLESEQNLKSELASTEEELRQALLETSQKLGRVREESEAINKKLTAKLKNALREKEEKEQNVASFQRSYNEKVSELGTCNDELMHVKEAYNLLVAEVNELRLSGENRGEEYSKLAGKFSTTEKHLSEFQRSVASENKESEKLLSKFRVQFEQVTLERDNLIHERDNFKSQLEEARVRLSLQKDDYRHLRQAVGSEVDIQYQTVSQIESLLGEERPPVSPVSPPCLSPVSPDNGSEDFPASEALISKFQRQNTSLAILIQGLATLKVTKEQQLAELTHRCRALENALESNMESFIADRESMEAELNLLRGLNEQLQEHKAETELKLQCWGPEGQIQSDQSGTATSKERETQKYIVEMDRDILTVSTVEGLTGEPVTFAGQNTTEGGGPELITEVLTEVMQISPQHSSPSVMSISDESPQTLAYMTDVSPSMARARDSAWHAEYIELQDKYTALLKDHEAVWKRLKSQNTGKSIPHEDASVEELAIDVSGARVFDLMEENVRLQLERTRLENELMSQRIDCLEVDAAYTELTWLKEQKGKLEQKLKLQHGMYEQEKKMLEHRLRDLQLHLDTLLTTKVKTKEEAQSWKHKYTQLSALSQGEVRELAKELNSEEERTKLSARVSTSEKVSGLESQVKAAGDDNAFLRMQVSHLKKECELYERHVRDLEKEVESQYIHLHEASREHKSMLQLLAETKVELEFSREKHQQFSKIGESVERIEAQLSGRSTPQLTLMHSPPITQSGNSTPRVPSRSVGGASVYSFDSSEDDTPRAPDTSKVLEEMVQLRQELMETKAIYSKENSLLKQVQLHKAAGKLSDIHFSALADEISVLQERNKHLATERGQYQKLLKEQEELVMNLQKQYMSTHEGSPGFEDLFGQQVQLLAAQRDELERKLQQEEEKDSKYLEFLREKTRQEEKFNKETKVLRKKLHEKEVLEIELIQKVTTLEHHIRRQQHLEDLSHHKGMLEEELSQQKRSFDTELSDVEKIIQDRRNVMKIERIKLLGDLEQKDWQKTLKLHFKLEDDESTEQEGPWRDNPRLTITGFEKIDHLKSDVERRYREAIERLRHELQKDYQSSSRKSSPVH